MCHEKIIKIMKLASKIVSDLISCQAHCIQKRHTSFCTGQHLLAKSVFLRGQNTEIRLSEMNTESLVKFTENIIVINTFHNLYHCILS